MKAAQLFDLGALEGLTDPRSYFFMYLSGEQSLYNVLVSAVQRESAKCTHNPLSVEPPPSPPAP